MAKNPADFPRGIEVVSGPFILNDKNEVLLTRSPKWQGWLVCGGHIEPGETGVEACIRETKEELGVELGDLELVDVGEFFYYPPEFKRNAHFVFFNYMARIKSGEFRLDEREISEIRWFGLDEALALEDLKESCKAPIRKIKGILKERGML